MDGKKFDLCPYLMIMLINIQLIIIANSWVLTCNSYLYKGMVVVLIPWNNFAIVQNIWMVQFNSV